MVGDRCQYCEMQCPTNLFIAAAKELSGIWTQYSIPSWYQWDVIRLLVEANQSVHTKSQKLNIKWDCLIGFDSVNCQHYDCDFEAQKENEPAYGGDCTLVKSMFLLVQNARVC